MPEAVDAVIAAARDFLGERITTNATLREHHSHGQDTQPPVLPDAVAFIETSDEAARLLALCNNAHVPVVAWGAGTSLEGHVTPVRGGITLDLSHMTRIIDISHPVHALPSSSRAPRSRPRRTRAAGRYSDNDSRSGGSSAGSSSSLSHSSRRAVHRTSSHNSKRLP
jgi:hypothetical protein